MQKLKPVNIPEITNLARKYHDGQFRHDGTTPYISHPMAVASIFSSDRLKAVALLHDVIEDCNVSACDLLDKGIPQDIVDAVCLLTRIPGQDYLSYILDILRDDMARQVKIQDIKHNLPTARNKDKKDKYNLALYILEHKDNNWS